MIPPINEFILWANCTNKCKFCLQNLKADHRCVLSEDEKLSSIQKTYEKLSDLPYGDILLIGGEICGGVSKKVAESLLSLIEFCRERIESGLIRYLYLNTNLLYKNLDIIYDICSLFSGYEDHLRLTTSYDVYGRFSSIKDKKLFFDNASAITSRYPEQPLIVNTILTHQYYTSGITVRDIVEKTGARSVVLVPYIPVKYGDEMTPTPDEIFDSIENAESEYPGYIRKYVDNFDLKQDRTLWEYHSNIDSLEMCESPSANCGHNSNFARVLGGKCFVCELKEKYKRYVSPDTVN